MSGKRRTDKDLDPEEVLRFLRAYFTYDEMNGGFIVTVKRTNHSRSVGSRAGVINDQRYVTLQINGRVLKEHRLVWLWHTGSWPEHEIDHLDGIRNRNLIENLRDVEKAVNRKNMVKLLNNTSGGTGVYKHPKYAKWKAYVGANSRQTHLGTFNSLSEAQEARARWIAARPELGFTERHGT